MGDLISRQALIEKLNRNSIFKETTNAEGKNTIEIIEDQPAAYNLESVVGQLEAIKKDRFEWCRMQNMKACNEHEDCTEHLLAQIIEIVKAGGQNG